MLRFGRKDLTSAELCIHKNISKSPILNNCQWQANLIPMDWKRLWQFLSWSDVTARTQLLDILMKDVALARVCKAISILRKTSFVFKSNIVSRGMTLSTSDICLKYCVAYCFSSESWKNYELHFKYWSSWNLNMSPIGVD